ncbi:MAG: amidase [Chloroflexi bacterium]|nr:amidase [Chloroflexota bacterium]
MTSQNVYDLKSVKLPRMASGAFRLFVGLLENPLTRGLLIPQLLQSGGITGFRDVVIDDPPTYLPIVPAKDRSMANEVDLEKFARQKIVNPKGLPFATVLDYADAYRAGAITPETVAENFLAAVKESDARDPALRAFIAIQRDDVMAQARASTKRIQAGKPLSVFDGVPVAFKDEADMVPYGTTVGTKFLGKTPAQEDSTVAACLRRAGALLVGKTNMHEIGFVPTGMNPHHGTPRNPYNPAHYTGGSSSGSAAAVASGLCPVAIGADGGGSIRIPAAFCGIVGLKATYGRVSEYGAAQLDWSVAHKGPLAATAHDSALMYAVIAGADPRDENSLYQSAVTLEDFDKTDMHGLRVGIFSPWFKHATGEVVEACEKMVQQFQAMGAQVCEIEIPELDAARVAHLITIATELATAMDPYAKEHDHDFGLDVRTNLALARALTSRDYVHAQRMRTRAMTHLTRAFEQVDVIATPATALVAPKIPIDALATTETDLSTVMEIMRYVFLSNLTGNPALTFPVGYNANGLPISLQLIGRHWEEHTLFRMAYAAEHVVERRTPQIFYRLLQ